MAKASQDRERGGMFAALRVPGYRWVWGSGIMGALGFMTYGMGQGWLLLELTDSPLWVGLAPGLTGVVAIILSPFGGVLADRMDRRKVLMAGHALMAVALIGLGALTMAGWVQLWHVLLVAVLQGGMRAVQPARTSLTFDLVGRSRIQNAMAAQFTGVSGASATGPLAGGFIMDAFGPGLLFVIIGVLAAVAVLLLTRVQTPPRAYAAATSVWKNLTEGLAFAVRDKPVRSVLSLVALTEICGFAVISMLPVVAKEVLQADGRVLGSLMSLWGVGGMAASLLLSARGDFKRKGWVFVSAAFSMGLGLVLFSLSRELLLSLALILVVGAAASTYDIMGNSLLQVLAPDALRGRITGVHSLLLSGSAAGSMGMGAIAEVRGVALAIALGGGIVLLNALRIVPRAGTLGERPAEAVAAVGSPASSAGKSGQPPY